MDMARAGVADLCVLVAQGEDWTPDTRAGGPYLEMVPKDSDEAEQLLSARTAASRAAVPAVAWQWNEGIHVQLCFLDKACCLWFGVCTWHDPMALSAQGAGPGMGRNGPWTQPEEGTWRQLLSWESRDLLCLLKKEQGRDRRAR